MKYAALFILILTLSACSSSPTKIYDAMSGQGGVKVFDEGDVIEGSAIDLPTTIEGLSFSRQSFKIEETDPIIDFGEYKSNYKLFSFSLDQGDKFNINILSLCSCLGFDKRILVPKTVVLDSSGKVVDTEIVNPQFSLPSISYNITGEASSQGTYYLLFAANNSAPGQSVGIGTAKINGYIPTGIRLSNKSNPYGKFIPSFKIIE